MELSVAKKLLNECIREDRTTHGLDGVGVFWRKGNAIIADGYFEKKKACVVFVIDAMFEDQEARELRFCGLPMRYSHANMMEGPRTKIDKFSKNHWMVQIGWLGQSGTFYPCPSIPTREQEPGSYSPVYMEDGD